MAIDYCPEGKVRWFIYVIQDIPCSKIYTGSTQNPVSCFSNHKSTRNNPEKQKHGGTGLCRHFKSVCPNDSGKDKRNLNITLIDFYDTTEEKLLRAGHVPGPKCRCKECQNLKDLKDFHILRLG